MGLDEVLRQTGGKEQRQISGLRSCKSREEQGQSRQENRSASSCCVLPPCRPGLSSDLQTQRAKHKLLLRNLFPRANERFPSQPAAAGRPRRSLLLPQLIINNSKSRSKLSSQHGARRSAAPPPSGSVPRVRGARRPPGLRAPAPPWGGGAALGPAPRAGRGLHVGGGAHCRLLRPRAGAHGAGGGAAGAAARLGRAADGGAAAAEGRGQRRGAGGGCRISMCQ